MAIKREKIEMDKESEEVVDLTSDDGRASSDWVAAKGGKVDKDQEDPLVTILGSIDGIRDDIVAIPGSSSSSDPLDWKLELEPRIVECKHRVERFRTPPPLYEQIQVTTYCLLFEIPRGEIVQVLRRPEATKAAGDPCKASMPSRHTSVPQSPLFHVSPVDLSDPIAQHEANFRNFVLPRLRSCIDAVLCIRETVEMRYRLLLSTAEGEDGMDGWKLLHELCPWLLHCDTAFVREASIAAAEL